MAKVLIEESDLNKISAAVQGLVEALSGIKVERTGILPPRQTKPASGFRLSEQSLKRAEGVNEKLVQCAKLAIHLSLVDFGIFEGLRTAEHQRELVNKGASRTMQSKHIQGLALDLVPWIGGKFVWDWDGCAKIAFAMDQAATELGIAHRITWGGAWDRKLSDYGGRLELYMQEVEKYKARHAGSDFIDGPHFEILP